MPAIPMGDERPPFDLTVVLPNIEMLRDTAASMALCGNTFDDVRTMLESKRTACANAIAAEYEHRTFDLRRQINAAGEAAKNIEKLIDDAKNNRIQIAAAEQKRLDLHREIAALQQEIRKKKVAAEREEFKRLLDKTNERVRSAEDRLTEEQKTAFQRQHETWQKQSIELDRRVRIFEDRIAELDQCLAQARERAKPLVERHITRTVAGFLLWVGYGSFAAIGSTIALLLPPLNDQKAPLAQILGAVRGAVAGFPRTWGVGSVFLVSLVVFFLGLVAFCALILGLDWLLQKFDLDWKREARRGGARNKDRSRSSSLLEAQLSAASLPVVRRGSYVQLIAALPYIMITGAITCLLAASAHNAVPGTPPGNVNAVPASIVATYIGTVLALLMTSSFVMYVLKIIERRVEGVAAQSTSRPSWKTGWEFFVIPFVLVGSLTYAMTQTEASQRVWGPIAVFMLLSCLAVAYGVVYRGIFYDIDCLERERARCLRAVAEAKSITEPDLEDTSAVCDARDALRTAKQYRDRIDSLQWPGLVNDAAGEAPRFFRWRRPAVPAVPFDLSLAVLTDAEAAPKESQDLLQLNARMSDAEQDLARATAASQGVDPLRLYDQMSEIDQRREQAESRREALEFERHRADWELNGQIENMLIELRAAFDVARTVEPAVSRIAAAVRKG